MPVFVICPNCGAEYTVKHKKCPRCGAARPVGRATYRIYVTHNYRRVKKSISGITLTQARQIEAKAKQMMVDREYSLFEDKIEFSFYFEEKYLEHARREKRSYSREETLYRLWIKPVIGSKTLASIGPLDIERIKTEMMNAGKSPRTVEYALAVVRHAFNRAIEWGIFSGRNPVSRVKKPRKDNRRVRFLTRDEAEALLNELKKHSIQVYEMAYLSLYTGMRFGEITNLTWQDVDFENNIITIKDPKNRESRSAYITRDMRYLLLEKFRREMPKSQSELLFKDSDGKKIVHISKTFPRVVDKLGLNRGVEDPRDKVVFHTLRHTFASWLAIQGTPIYTIKELMGHKTLAMTERYSHLIPDIKREAVEKLAGSTGKNGGEELKD